MKSPHRAVRPVLLVVAVLLLAAAVPVAAHGVRVDEFPSFLTPAFSAPAGNTAGSAAATVAPPPQGTPITHFSPPWIAGAAGLVLIALVLLLVCLADVARSTQRRRSFTTSDGSIAADPLEH